MNSKTLIIVGGSAELELALDALADLELSLVRIPTLTEARERVRGFIGAGGILLDLRDDVASGLRIIRSVRRTAGMRNVPVVVWSEHRADLASAYSAGATSGVVLDGSSDAAIRLTTLIHYWASVSEPPHAQALA